MNKKANITVVFILLLLGYVAAYGCFRLSGHITHFQNTAMPQGPEVKASVDLWANINSEMTKDSDSLFFRLSSLIDETEPKVLNTVFWPLRELESAYWRRSTD